MLNPQSDTETSEGEAVVAASHNGKGGEKARSNGRGELSLDVAEEALES